MHDQIVGDKALLSMLARGVQTFVVTRAGRWRLCRRHRCRKRPHHLFRFHFTLRNLLQHGGLKIAQIATQDIGDHAALRLVKMDFKGKEIQELLGQREISMEEATTVLGKAIGKPDLKYVQFPYPDALQAMMGMGFSKSVAESFVEMNKGFNEGIFGKPQRTAANTTATSIEEFATHFAVAYNS